MQEIIKGDKKGDGAQENERDREGGWEVGKHYSSMPSKHEMLGSFNRKPWFKKKGGKTQNRRAKHTGKTWESESNTLSRMGNNDSTCVFEMGRNF